MSSVIRVENLSKKYIIGHQKQESQSSLREVLTEGAKNLANKLIHPFAASENDPNLEEFWALKDVSFDIQQGDRVGIIGRNGAGKSTLLKILSRITEPTSGKVSIKGRVASLLEVGTGFHPELSGRENIFLNGAILGMSKAEIRKKFDEIVAFAEVERFLDTPVKRYSSGMYLRLAFAVAAHLEPEILIVDEVLAVGDASFQKKCMNKMEDVGKEGRTILFVSHNMGAIQQLTKRCILLRGGELDCVDDVAFCIERYLSFSSEHQKEQSLLDPSEQIDITGMWFEGDKLESGFNKPLEFAFDLNVRMAIQDALLGLGFKNSLGSKMATLTKQFDQLAPGHYRLVVRLHDHRFPPGHYSVDLGVEIQGRGGLYATDVLGFSISPNGIEDRFLATRGDRLGVYLVPETELIAQPSR